MVEPSRASEGPASCLCLNVSACGGAQMAERRVDAPWSCLVRGRLARPPKHVGTVLGSSPPCAKLDERLAQLHRGARGGARCESWLNDEPARRRPLDTLSGSLKQPARHTDRLMVRLRLPRAKPQLTREACARRRRCSTSSRSSSSSSSSSAPAPTQEAPPQGSSTATRTGASPFQPLSAGLRGCEGVRWSPEVMRALARRLGSAGAWTLSAAPGEGALIH